MQCRLLNGLTYPFNIGLGYSCREHASLLVTVTSPVSQVGWSLSVCELVLLAQLQCVITFLRI